MQNTLAGFAIIAARRITIRLMRSDMRMATSQGIDAVSNLVNSGSPHEIKDAVLQQLNDNSSLNDKNIYNNSRLCRILVMSCLLLAAGLSALRNASVILFCLWSLLFSHYVYWTKLGMAGLRKLVWWYRNRIIRSMLELYIGFNTRQNGEGTADPLYLYYDRTSFPLSRQTNEIPCLRFSSLLCGKRLNLMVRRSHRKLG